VYGSIKSFSCTLFHDLATVINPLQLIENQIFLYSNLSVSSYLFLDLGSLPVPTLIAEVRRLHDRAYELGIDERKEMTRGKYLNIFKRRYEK